ncbi:MAG TPA: three-Cys-motif partner protein TcmP [Gammaproteobacteria bacterium]|jgi:three-Cys-motif partner protein|nr:three-Cys-motif partner protein TcmP [Gammaproteobacteria bacterium]
MSAKLPTVWEAPQHTIAKIEMLKSYLFAWLSIIGTRFAQQDLWYIDGFAGPGEYTNFSDGSPVAALKTAETAIQRAGGRWSAGYIHCVFIEEDGARFQHLQQRLMSLPEHPRIRRYPYHGTFVDGVNALRREAVNPFTAKQPLFAFIDPFGPEGLSFATVKELLARPACEVLVNLDSDGINRVYQAGESANHRERLNEVFGDAAWESQLAGSRQQTQAARKIVAMYKDRLRALPNVRYVFAFEMRSRKNAIDYHLVFASQHPTGLEKMKEVMRRLDQDGSYCFSDDGIGQETMFRFDDSPVYAKQLLSHFHGQDVTYEEVRDYALNESPFANPKGMLKELEATNKITVSGVRSNRRRGTFPEDTQADMRIQFHN